MKKRKTILIGSNTVAYTAGLAGLYQLWYKDDLVGDFHFFDDSKDWLQMDKFGHSYSCYTEGVLGMEMMKWAGYSKQQATWIGGAYGFFIQTTIEVFDGFSGGWGFSLSDIGANAFGAGLAIGQELAWEEQRIVMKFGFSPSEYASLRPNKLGSSYLEQLLKDYNAQTHWLSVNPGAFTPESKWPAWLNVAVGYGADGMYGGDDNVFERNGQWYDYSGTQRIRQWYISPDIDLRKIKTSNKFLRASLFVLNSIKFPMPAIELNSKGQLQFHPIMF